MLGQPKKNRNIKGLQIVQAAVKPGTANSSSSSRQPPLDPNGTLNANSVRSKSRTADTSTSSTTSTNAVGGGAGGGGSNPSLSSSSTLSSPSFPSSARDSLPSPSHQGATVTVGGSSHAALAAGVGGGWTDDSSYPPSESSYIPSSNANKRESTNFTQQLANLELGVEFKLDLRSEDLEVLHEVGSGNGGTVSRARHIPTGAIMARKVVHIDAKPAVRKQILRELQIMHDCHSEYIVSFYGAFLSDGGVCMCMQFMDLGSLDNIYKKNGPIPVDILGKIAWAVISGLTYLYDVHRIMHRDVKPSNILVNSQGEIKICDFGVSGELINSILNTFVGTSVYMSPERIRGSPYTARSDVWSFGITLIEIGLGRFPFSSSEEDDEGERSSSELDPPIDTGTAHPPSHHPLDEPTLSPSHPKDAKGALVAVEGVKKRRKEKEEKKKDKEGKKGKKKKEKRKSGVSLEGGVAQMSIFELLQYVVNEPAPELPERFPVEVRDFVKRCLEKDEERRLMPKQLLEHEWMVKVKDHKVDVETWAKTLK